MLLNAAGDDALVMAEIGRDIQGDAVKADPAADAYAERRDFGFAPGA